MNLGMKPAYAAITDELYPCLTYSQVIQGVGWSCFFSTEVIEMGNTSPLTTEE